MKITYSDTAVSIADIPFSVRQMRLKLKKLNPYERSNIYPKDLFGYNFSFIVGKTGFLCIKQKDGKAEVCAFKIFRKRDVKRLLKILFPDKMDLLVNLI